MPRRRLAVLLAVAVAVGAPVLAWGYWGAVAGADGQGAAAAAEVNQGATPTAMQTGPAEVTVSWGASTLSNGHAVDGYLVERYDAGSGAVQVILAGCSGTISATSCAESGVPTGQWKYTITPVIATNWRGPESVKSGAVTIGAPWLTLSKALFGATLPEAVTGSLAGFSPSEGVSYRLDAGTTLTGSPSSAGVGGSAAITSLTIPSAADGPHTVYAIGSLGSQASLAIVIDTTPPGATAQLSPAPNGAGWNTAPVDLELSADDGSGSGIAELKYTTDGSDPKTSGTAVVYSTPVTISTTTTVKYIATDHADNTSAVQTRAVSIDATAPVNVLSVAPLSGSAAKSANTVYYRGLASGSFSLSNALTDSGGSGPASSATAAPAGPSTGWTHSSSLVGTPAAGPYVSAPFSWTAGTTSSPTQTVTGRDAAGNAVSTTLVFVDDSTPPAGGSVDATGLAGTGGRYSTSLTLSLGFTKGTDAGVGLAASGAQLLRASAALSSADGVANGACGTYGTATQVGADDPSSPIANTAPTDNRCYRYEYRVPDQLGNVATYSSPDIKVETTAPGSLTPSAAVITPVSGAAAQSLSGSTVYYNPAQSGSFTVDSDASDLSAGVAAMAFPALGGFSGGGSVTTPYAGTTFRSTYGWSSNGASASPGQQALGATSGADATATNLSAFSVVKDATGPSGGAVDATGLGGTGSRYSTSTILSVAFTTGTDGGSGLATSGAQLLRATAALTSGGTSDGACGGYSLYVAVGAADPASPKLDTVTDHACYRYRYVVSDRVGNATTYTSPDIKVSTTAPSTPALAFSALSNAYWSGAGSTVYYRPGAASGAFTVTGSATDAFSGIASYAFPTFPAGWTSAAGTLGVNTYSWASPGPSAPGSQSVTAGNNAGVSSSSGSFALVADSTAPAGGTVGYTSGYFTTASVSVTFTKGTDGGSGLNTTSGLLQRADATLSAGACGSFSAFATIATDPTSAYADSGVSTGNCYQYRYLVSDNVGNQAAYTNAGIAKVDTQAPVNALSLATSSGASLSGTTLYFKGNAAGSFKFVNTLNDAASGPASATFPVVATTGWTHAAETLSAPAGGPFTSSFFSWTSSPGVPTGYSVTGQDGATNVATTALTFDSDITVPTGGSVTYTDGIVNALSVPVTTADGTDAKSGIDATSGIVERDQAALNLASGVCGAFPGTFATTVTLTGGNDTSVTSGSCFMYRYKVSDKVGNQATSTSASVAKIDANPRVTAIESIGNGGGAGNGAMAIGDKLVLTFSQSLATASVPTSFTGATESRAATGSITQLTIPGITDGALATGSTGYLAGPGLKTATFTGTVALVNNGAATTVTITVTAISGDMANAGSGALAFKPATTITNAGGYAAAGTFTTASTFKIF